jgi:hypothetical protein
MNFLIHFFSSLVFLMFLSATIFATVYEKINQNKGIQGVKITYFNIVNNHFIFEIII